MKHLYKLLLATALLVIAGHVTVRAQGELGELIKSGPGDATKLANAYLNPLFKGLGIGLNSGWYNSARPKGVGHFEIRVGATGAFVPSSAQSFDVTKLGLQSVTLASGSTAMAPTLFGDDAGATPKLQTTAKDPSGNPAETFNLPNGIGFDIAPAPQIQATIGLPAGIDASLRMVPKVKIGDDFGQVNMIGGGLKFNVLPLISKVSRFNLALAVGYTQIKYTYPLSVKPDAGSIPADPSQVKDFSNQSVDAKFTGVNAELILSKKLGFFTPFVSAGVNQAKNDVGLKGNYPFVTGAVLSGTTVTKTYTTFTNPVTLKDTAISGVKGTVGFAMNLLILKLYGSYSLGEYNSANVGIGIGF